MRTINWKFAAALVVVLAGTAAGVHVFHVVQTGRSADALLDMARQCREQGQHDQAVRYAAQYLEFRPDDVAALREMAGLMAQKAATSRQRAGVLNLYERILRLAPDDVETRLKAIDLAIRQFQYADALGNLDKLCQGKPDDADLLTRVGYCRQMLGKYPEAADCYRRALRANPKKTVTSGYLAQLLQNQLKRPDEARQVIEAAVVAAPQDGDAYAVRAQFLRTLGKNVEARADFRKALELKPNLKTTDSAILLAAAEVEQLTGNWAGARALFAQGNALFPKSSKFTTSLAWALFYEGKPELAIEKLRKGHELNPKDADILTLLAEVYAQNGEIVPLEKTLAELKALKVPTDPTQAEQHARSVQFVEARLAMRRGQWAVAAGLFNDLRKKAQRVPTLRRQANYLYAQCAAALNDAAAEFDAYRQIIDSDASASGVQLEYARALSRRGRHADALKQFLPVVARPDAPGRWVGETARHLLGTARSDAAAFAALTRAIDSLRTDGDNANPVLARAELDRLRGRPADSLPAVERLLGGRPKNIALHLARAALLDQVFGLDRALAALAEAERHTGPVAEYHMARARLYAARMEPAAAPALPGIGRGVERFTPEDRVRVLEELVNAYRAVGDAAGTQAQLERLAAIRPDHLAARELLAGAAIRAGNDARRQTILHEIEAVEGKDGPTALRIEALRRLYLHTPGDATNLAQSRTALEAALRVHKGDAAAEFLLGRIEELSGNEAAALVRYKAACDGGLLDGACEELFACAPGHNGTQPVSVLRDRLPLADRLSGERYRTVLLAALPLYEGPARGRLAETLAAKADPTDGVEHVGLGRLFARMGLAGQAEEAFRRAAAAAPQSPEGMVALVADRAVRNDAAGLQTAIAEIRQKLPPIDAHIVIGRALEKAQKFDQARGEFEAAAALNPDDTRPLRHLASLALHTRKPIDAGRLLQQIVGMTKPTSAEDVRWARRSLAVLLVSTPARTSFEKAINLLDRNTAETTTPVEEDQRARVLVLATQRSRPVGGRTARQEAISIQEKLAESGSRTGDDLLLLAKLYRAENDEPKARAMRDRLKAEFSAYYPSVAYLAREALREHDLKACEPLLAALRKLGPSHFETVALDFQFLVLSGSADRGRRLLDDFVGGAASAQDRSARGLLAAGLVFDVLAGPRLDVRPEVQRDLRGMAVRLYGPAAGTNPQIFQRVLQLLCEDGQTPRAIDLVQRHRKTYSVETYAAALVLIVRKGQADGQQTRATEQFLTEAVAQAPRSVSLRLALAHLFDHTGRHEEAVAQYRQVLALDPSNVAALNNLAWVLSYDRRNEGKIKEALARIEQAIDLAGPLDDLLDTRARIRAEMGQPDAALRDLTEAVCEVPTSGRYQQIAALHKQAGRADEAALALRRAERLGPPSLQR